ncbi:hypothetical protein [Streptomyces sp. RPT161]|uniref:hypothetical protein n=1 Tax=Streptomyces sp. RPT161 TaxID=3015993 RepID=UPI0022B92CD8|nr:hypothetical protein [Streptomyces sp. RPT161]
MQPSKSLASRASWATPGRPEPSGTLVHARFDSDALSLAALLPDYFYLPEGTAKSAHGKQTRELQIRVVGGVEYSLAQGPWHTIKGDFADEGAKVISSIADPVGTAKGMWQGIFG